MGNLSFYKEKLDKRYALAFLIALICSIICGIVLYKQVTHSQYLRNLASDYVYNVFNFKNSSLTLSHILGDLLYFYIFFFISFFTKFKYVNLIFVFFRGLFFGIYIVLIIAVNSFVGAMVVIFVFIPATVLSVAVCYFLSELCTCCDNKWIFAVPAILALLDCVVMLLLVNVVFRIVIIIV